MARDNVTIGHAEAGGVITDGVNLDVAEWNPRVLTPSQFHPSSLDGTAWMEIGVPKRVWKFVALVPESLYSTVIGWFLDATVAGNQYKGQFLEGNTIYNVMLSNRGEFNPEAFSRLVHTTGAYYEVPLEFTQIS